MLALLAAKKGRSDLAEVFRQALLDELGQTILAVVRGESIPVTKEKGPRIPESMWPLVEWLLDIFARKVSRD